LTQTMEHCSAMRWGNEPDTAAASTGSVSGEVTKRERIGRSSKILTWRNLERRQSVQVGECSHSPSAKPAVKQETGTLRSYSRREIHPPLS